MRTVLKYCSCALVLLLAASFVLLLALNRSQHYEDTLDQYLTAGENFTLADIPQDKTQQVQAYLQSQLSQHQAVLIRADDKFSALDGGAGSIHLGIMADPAALASLPDLSYLGNNLLNQDKLSLLLEAGQGKTLGLYQVEADVLEQLPQERFGPSLSVGKLSDLVENTGTINGSYSLYGLDQQQNTAFFAGLAEVTQKSKEDLLRSAAESNTVDSLLPQLMLFAGLGLSALLCLVFLIYLSLGAKELGTHLILGWSKTDYFTKLLLPIFCSLVLALLISLAGSWLTVSNMSLTLELLMHMLYPFALTVCVTGLAFALACLVLVGMQPIHALAGYRPQKLFTVLLALAFLGSSAGLYTAAAYLETPLREMQNLTKVKQEWRQVADQHILYSQQTGEDAASFSGQSSSYVTDFYSWYRSIEDQEGVSLVNTYYVSQQLLAHWRSLGEQVPNREFWYMAASPSYLQQVGITVPEDAVNRAKSGQQVFLLPQHFSQNDQESIASWAQNNAVRRGKAEQSISTAFTQDPVTATANYNAAAGLFTWNSEPGQDFRSQDVLIYLATTANMTYFESESLAATGLGNSYVKLSSAAAERYTASTYLASYNLADNQPVFESSATFVAGLQKSIQDYLQICGLLMGFLGLLAVGALLSFTSIYSLLNHNKIAVLRFLGHPLGASYKPAFLLISATNLVALGVLTLIGSQLGMLVSLGFLLIQYLLLYLVARRFADANTVSLIKES